ncbi:glycosyltransferase family A protein [Pedobacter frigiditerrae]|uniref:glycosyltransferase family A protein n=1 Tax=Pedobacter frigiditerrae TaxID=2530452 RepID=UPI00293024AB|nr:glycosyltransferase family A protein [Pedobacter frigiditerrae]
MDKPLVSIIIPVYNSEKYIEETLDSVSLQTFSLWECIIINDGSVDNSEAVILEKIKEDQRFKYIYQDNSGVCVARNIAIKQSIGDYVLCLDADDLISENFLEETVNLLQSDVNLGVATSLVKFFGRSYGTLKVISYNLEIILAANQLVVTSLFRRIDFDIVGGFNENMKEGFEDWDFWISILKRNCTVACATKATFYYRLLGASRNKNISSEKEQRLRYQIWENHKELFCQYFVNPTHYFEYVRVANSPEYKIGLILLAPVRQLKYLIYLLKNNLLFNKSQRSKL